jgi:hypothetical protein
VIHDRCSGSSRRNQWYRTSISVIVAVVILSVTPASLFAMVARALADGSRDRLIPRVLAAIG